MAFWLSGQSSNRTRMPKKQVREAVASAFQNIYAEGYPDEETRQMNEEQILDYPQRLAHYRRYGDPRYYKGVEYADAVEALARRRCAELFTANGISPDDIYVNVLESYTTRSNTH